MALRDAGVRDRRAGVPLFVATVDAPGHCVLEGELDLASVEALRAALEQAFLESSDIEVDVAGVHFVSSPVLTELLRFQIRAAAEKRQMRLVHLSAPVEKILDLLDLRELLAEPEGNVATRSVSEPP